MKQPSELTREQLKEIVGRIRDILWQDPVSGELDPDRSWDVETIERVSGVIEEAGLKPDPAPDSPSPTHQPDVAAMLAALESLIRTIEATGGCVRPTRRTMHPAGEEIDEFESDLPVPVADEEWPDLADCYLEACRATGREPMLRDMDADESPDDGGEAGAA